MLELNGPTLSFDEFCELCLKPNRPAIIRHAVPTIDGEQNGLDPAAAATAAAAGGKGFSTSFPSCFTVLNDMCERLSPMGLMRAFGPNHSVPTTEATACGPIDSGDQPDEGPVRCCHMPLRKVLEHWRSGQSSLYLKDWHMQSDFESLTSSIEMDKTTTATQSKCILHGDRMYQVPQYLGKDWMDIFCRQRSAVFRGFGDETSDYRFAYIGPPSTWTQLHFDVFGTYSWSLNVCGEKMWYFPFTSEDNARLLESGLNGIALPTDIRVTTGVEVVGVLQRPGDLVFVPSCYLHQVHNVHGQCFPLPTEMGGGTVELVMSVNHNWCNEWCVERMVDAFCRDAYRVRRLLTEEDRLALFGDDLSAWHEHVERMLLGGTNWNFACIRDFLQYTLECHVNGDGNDDNGRDGVGIRELLERCLGTVNTAELCVTGVSTCCRSGQNNKNSNGSSDI